MEHLARMAKLQGGCQEYLSHLVGQGRKTMFCQMPSKQLCLHNNVAKWALRPLQSMATKLVFFQNNKKPQISKNSIWIQCWCISKIYLPNYRFSVSEYEAWQWHHIGVMVTQITSNLIVCSTPCPREQHKISCSLLVLCEWSPPVSVRSTHICPLAQ